MPSQTRCHTYITYTPAAMGDGMLIGAQPREESRNPGRPAMRRKREHLTVSKDGSCGRDEAWIVGTARKR